VCVLFGARCSHVPNLARAKHFASWLGLCPDNRIISGGKILSRKTREVKNRVITALRLAAQSLWRAQNYFGDLYRDGRHWATRKRSAPWRTLERLGKPRKEFTAGEGPQGRTSGSERVQLARVVWHLLKYKEAFGWKVFEKEEAKTKRKKVARCKPWPPL
jgi:transposase